MHVSAGARGGQKMALEPLQLEVWALESLPTWELGLLQEQRALLASDHLSSPLINTSHIRRLHCNFMMNVGFVI